MFKAKQSKWIVAGIFFLASGSAFSADAEFKLLGSVNAAYSSKGVFLNFAGPNLKAEYGDFGAGLSLFPSLRYDTAKNSKAKLSPILGFGPFFNYTKFVVSLPMYFISNAWNVAFGVGYKF